MDKVAVILPVYKNDKVPYIRLSFDSILNQTYKDIHLYVGVDGPVGEELGDVLKSYEKSENVSVQWFPKNRGLAIVLNDLLDICFKAGYEYIARMDADDISVETRIEKQMAYMAEHPDIDVIGGAIEEIGYDGKLNGKVIRYPLTHEECFRFFATRNPLAHPAVMFNAKFFDKVESYNASFKKNQDTELWYRAFKAGCKFGNLEDVVLTFRVSKDMYKRRGGTKFALEVLKLRNEINRGLGYGLKATLFGYAYFIMAISPGWVKKFAYKVFR